MAWQKLPKPSTLWEEGEKWFELEDNLEEGKFDFLEYKEEPPPKGIILQRDVSVAMGPETLGTPGDFSRIWVAFTDQETGEIYLARSDAEWNQWEEYLHIIYAPSGSYQPSLTFGSDGWHRMAVTLIPAGEEIPEVWIIEPPYSGDGIRRLDLGEHPRIFQDYWGNTWVFYYKPEIGAIYSKSSKDNFASATELNLSNRGYPPLGVRLLHWKVTPYHDQFRNVLFFGSGKNMPFYVVSQIEDVFTVGLSLSIIGDKGFLPQVEVHLYGIGKQTSDENGKVLFLGLEYPQKITYKLTHPSYKKSLMGTIEILTEDAGTLVEKTLTMFRTQDSQLGDSLQTSWQVSGIEWEYLGAIKELVSEPLNTLLAVDGIQWEGLSTIIECIQEDVSTVLQVQGLVWNFIHRDYSSNEEELSISLSVQNILWVEVTE
jgi:hypothetical protein